MRSEAAARLPRSLEEERKMKKDAGPSPEHSHALTQKARSFSSFDLPVNPLPVASRVS
jgi:hypothetical protein